MKRKALTYDDMLSHYRELYIEKGRLTLEERERALYWLSLKRLNKEIEDMKPFVMGGYPKMMHDCITPYYQWIATIFVFMGIILTILSIGGLFAPLLNSWVNYFIPAVVSILFGLILFFFIRNVKK